MSTYLKIQQVFNTANQPKIAIVRSLPGLGDMLCSVPALRALRCALSSAEIVLIGLPNAKPFMQRFHTYVDKLIEFPGFPGIPEVPVDATKMHSFLEQVHSMQFDLALQLHGDGSCTNAFTRLLGAKQNAGFYPTQAECPNPRFFMPYPESGSEIWRLLNLLKFLGIPLQGSQLEFPLTTQDWQDWNAIAVSQALSHAYVCIHPGASVLERRWPPDHFAAVADHLAALGFQIVLTGSSTEKRLVQAVADKMQFPAINLAGMTSLGALAILLKGAQLLVCNDTGVSHLAAALPVKSVVIFSSSDPHRWAPLNQELHRVVVVKQSERSQLEQPLKSSHYIHHVITEAINAIGLEFSYAS